MMPPKERMCHLTGFTKSCRQLVNDEACGRWSQVQGRHPQTGVEMDRWACVDDHIPTLLLTIAKLTLEAGAATESFRNEVMGRAAEAPQLAPVGEPKRLS